MKDFFGKIVTAAEPVLNFCRDFSGFIKALIVVVSFVLSIFFVPVVASAFFNGTLLTMGIWATTYVIYAVVGTAWVFGTSYPARLFGAWVGAVASGLFTASTVAAGHSAATAAAASGTAAAASTSVASTAATPTIAAATGKAVSFAALSQSATLAIAGGATSLFVLLFIYLALNPPAKKTVIADRPVVVDGVTIIDHV